MVTTNSPIFRKLCTADDCTYNLDVAPIIYANHRLDFRCSRSWPYKGETRRVSNFWEITEMVTPMETDMLARLSNLDRDMNVSRSNEPEQQVIFCKLRIVFVQFKSKFVFTLNIARWRHQMKTSSALLALCVGNSPVTGEFPTQRPVTRSFGVFFDLSLE